VLPISTRQILCAEVLVVEDNPMSRAMAVEIFEELGFAVFGAYNGQHALALLEARPESCAWRGAP
jgi:CheY-like chemotaxis protein